MKIATICHCHWQLSGGIKWQLYLAEELYKMGHEIHFYLKDLKKPDWFNTVNFHYHPYDEIFHDGHSGDLLMGNWYLVSEVLNAKHVIKNWKKRLLVVHDIPTASNYKNCLDGNFKISCVSSSLYNLVTSQSQRRNLDRVLPMFPHCGYNPGIFNTKNREESDTIRIVSFDRWSPDENDDGWDCRGTQYVKEIRNAFISRKDILFQFIKTNSEEETATAFKNADCYIDCGVLAGMPVPLVESMACGCVPIITTQGTLDIVLDGMNGILIPKGRAQFIVNKLNLCLKPELINQFKKNISVNSHTWEKQAKIFMHNLLYY